MLIVTQIQCRKDSNIGLPSPVSPQIGGWSDHSNYLGWWCDTYSEIPFGPCVCESSTFPIGRRWRLGQDVESCRCHVLWVAPIPYIKQT